MPGDIAVAGAEVIRVWFEDSFLLSWSPPFHIPGSIYLCPNDSYFLPACLTTHLTLETHYKGFPSFRRGGTSAEVGCLKTQSQIPAETMHTRYLGHPFFQQQKIGVNE